MCPSEPSTLASVHMNVYIFLLQHQSTHKMGGHDQCQQHETCLNTEETTQLSKKATWEKGPTIEPRTRDLRFNVKFQPRELRNRPRFFVPHRPLCASIIKVGSK